MAQIQELNILKEKLWRASAEQRDALKILQPLSTFKIDETEKECLWDVFTEEILPCLPANQLQTLSVSKNWFRIISSPYFARLHLNIYNQSRIRVLMPEKYSMMTMEYKYNTNSRGDETKLHIRYPPAMSGKRFKILGSCDGLLCLHIGLRIFVVYNPSTGKYFGVQLIRDLFNVYINICWFGEHSGEYVLVLGNFNWEVGVYKFSSSSKLELIHSTSCCIDSQAPARLIRISFCDPRRGTLLHGALHWPAELCGSNHGTRYVICAYHLQDNKYFEISPPVQCRHFKLGVADGCLFAIFKPTTNVEFEMWIMKEYEVEQSWTKYANIQGFSSYKVLSPLGFFPNGDLILDADKRKLFKYSFNDVKVVLLMNRVSAGSEAITCADSLVSPTIVGGGVE